MGLRCHALVKKLLLRLFPNILVCNFLPGEVKQQSVIVAFTFANSGCLERFVFCIAANLPIFTTVSLDSTHQQDIVQQGL